MNLNNNVIEFENVGIRYGNGEEVLKDVNINLRKNSFYFLTGESGAGKTTFLSLIYLANKPTRGKVKIFNKDISNLERKSFPEIRRKVGVVFQDYRLLDHLSVYDNVALPLKVAGKGNKYIKKHVPELLNWVGLGNKMDSYPPTLSGGQKQRVAIARAVINKPDILLADEPTGNVDEEMGLKLMHLFVELNRLGTCVIVATHSKNLINKFPFKRLHLHDGNISDLKF